VKAAIQGRNPRLPGALFLFRCGHRLLCLVFLSLSLPLARAPWNPLHSSALFFFFGSPFVSVPSLFPLFCFSSRDVSPSVVCLFLFPPFPFLDAGMNCGCDMFLSFALFSQSSIFRVNLLVQYGLDLFLTFSRKESLTRVCHGIAALVI